MSGLSAAPAGVRARLQAIRAAAEDVQSFAGGMCDEGFRALPDSDRRTHRALKDALGEIGEMVGGLPADVLARHPGVDWRGWKALRALVSDRHAPPDMRRLRLVVADDLPALLAAVGAEIARMGDGLAADDRTGPPLGR